MVGLLFMALVLIMTREHSLIHRKSNNTLFKNMYKIISLKRITFQHTSCNTDGYFHSFSFVISFLLKALGEHFLQCPPGGGDHWPGPSGAGCALGPLRLNWTGAKGKL